MKTFLFTSFLFLLFGTTTAQELRGLWVASVINLDFPSDKNLTPELQQTEFISLLDRCKAVGINAIFVQVRPSGDALYPSMSTPFSEWLVGEQGKIPEPFYDPLAFMIEESHKRGIEFHAWFNPFRAVFNNRTRLSKKHIFNQKPECFVRYGAQRIFNPGIPEVREYINDLINEVVMRYDIDGIHLDDYFYPYPQEGVKDFADDSTFVTYGQNFTSKADWRRNNVDLFIQSLHQEIKRRKKWVKFGVSPFGVWRNKADDPEGSDSRAGIMTYDVLYADVRKWLKEGWLDYIAPQIYFSVGNQYAPYEKMIEWWQGNAYGRHVYMGEAVYKIQNSGDKAWNNPREMPLHLRLSQVAPKGQGNIYFRSKVFWENPAGLLDSLQASFYQTPTFPPQMPWLDDKPPLPPRNLELTGYRKGVLLEWENRPVKSELDKARYIFIYRFKEGEAQDLTNPKSRYQLLAGDVTSFVDTSVKKKDKYIYVLTTMDRMHNESLPVRSDVFKYRKKYRKR